MPDDTKNTGLIAGFITVSLFVEPAFPLLLYHRDS